MEQWKWDDKNGVHEDEEGKVQKKILAWVKDRVGWLVGARVIHAERGRNGEERDHHGGFEEKNTG